MAGNEVWAAQRSYYELRAAHASRLWLVTQALLTGATPKQVADVLG